MSSETQTDQCSICLSSLNEKGKDVFKTACNHRFHFDCLVKSVAAQNHECPLCRTHLDALARLFQQSNLQSPSMNSNLNSQIENNNRRGWWQTIRQSFVNSYGRIRNNQPQSTERLETSLSRNDDKVDQNQVRCIIDRINERRRLMIDQSQQLQNINVTTALEFQAQQYDQESNMFAMIKLKAPSLITDANVSNMADELHVPADLVCVIDQSGSMSGEKLSLVKETLNYLIDQLTALDRLAIISFNTQAVNQSNGLKKMTPNQKTALKSVISSGVHATGGTYIGSGLEMAIGILNQRRTKNSIGALLLLTDGQDNQNHDYSNIMRRLPTDIVCHTFGFGLGHRADLLSQIAEQGNSGTFTYIDQISSVSLAFATALGSLFTCIAQNLRVHVRLQEAYNIVATHSIYQYEPNQLPTRNLIFKLHDLNAEEVRHLVFELRIPTINEPSDEPKSIGQVTLEYTDAINQSTVQTDSVPFILQRPGQISATSPLRNANHELDVQRNRAETSRVLRDAARNHDFNQARTAINEQRDKIARSVSSQDPLCQQLIRDLEFQYENHDQFITTMTNMSMQHGQERATYACATTLSSNAYMTSGQERFRSLVKRS